MHGFANDRIIWLLVLAAGWIAQAVRKASAKAAKARETQKADSGQDDRARRVREDVARKIAAKRAMAPSLRPPSLRPAPAPTRTRTAKWNLPTPAAKEVEAASPPRRERPALSLPEPTFESGEATSALVVAAPFSGGDAAPTTSASTVLLAAPPRGAAGVPASARRSDLIADLRQPASARRAVLLREIIGPPVGLRRPS